MTISALQLDSETFVELGIGISELPLDPSLHLHSLGSVVVIAGPNGAGKSRLLRLISSLSIKILSDELLVTLQIQRAQAIQHIAGFEAKLAEFTERRKQGERSDSFLGQEAENMQALSHFRSQLVTVETAFKGHSVFTLTRPGPLKVVNFVPSNPQLADASSSPDSQVKSAAAAISHGGSDNAEVNSPAYARTILRAGLLSRDPRRTGDLQICAAGVAEMELRTIVGSLLGSSFHFDLNADLNLHMGRIDGDLYTKELSQGQQILFQFACMLHAQGAHLRESIILLDEPENHLHPAVLNEVVDRLRGSSGVSQVWVATHSVPLIAHVLATDPDCLWYAEGGRFSRAGRAPARVLEGLMGGSEAAANLQALTRLPAEYAALRFLSECLIEPGVAGPDTKDPQTNQIAEILSSLQKRTGQPLRIVDFGAGVGRLLSTLVAFSPTTGFATAYDYIGLESDLGKHLDLKAEIFAAYGSEDGRRVFSDVRVLQSEIDAGTVACIVMCNVLHEIHPDEWTELFAADGPLLSTLSANGYILFVEDYGITVGERAHRYGFLLLDSIELSALFQIRETDRDEESFVRVASSVPRYEARLVAHLVSKKCVSRVTGSTRRDAIRLLGDRARSSVAAYLEAPSSQNSGAGRDYARNAQLFANAAIWLHKNSEGTQK